MVCLCVRLSLLDFSHFMFSQSASFTHRPLALPKLFPPFTFASSSMTITITNFTPSPFQHHLSRFCLVASAILHLRCSALRTSSLSPCRYSRPCFPVAPILTPHLPPFPPGQKKRDIFSEPPLPPPFCASPGPLVSSPNGSLAGLAPFLRPRAHRHLVFDRKFPRLGSVLLTLTLRRLPNAFSPPTPLNSQVRRLLQVLVPSTFTHVLFSTPVTHCFPPLPQAEPWCIECPPAILCFNRSSPR